MLTIVFAPYYGVETQRLNFNSVLPTPPVYLIFWGSYWIQGNGPNFQQQIILDAQNVINSSFLQGTAQYGTGGTASYASALATNRTGEPANGFHTSQLADIEHGLAQDGYIPHGNDATPTPIFAFITPPGIQSDDGTTTIGYNTNLSPSGESADFPTIWCSTAVQTASTLGADYFTKVFSHEMAECMTDFSQNGFEVNPGSTYPNPEANAYQIGDYEAKSHLYREYTGALVQSIWSRDDNAFIVREGNTQKFNLANASGGGYDLTLNGDQPGHSDDIFYIDTVSTPAGDEVKAVINSEVAVFEPGTIKSVTINTLGGTNTVYVAATNVPVTIHGNPNDTVKIGVGGTVQGIKADVTVSQANRVHMIEVDDSSDPTALHPAVGFGIVSNLLPSSHYISFPFGVNGANQNLTIDTGPGTSAFDVTGTVEGGSVTLNAVQGASTINVDQLDSNGPLTINLGGGAQNVNISSVANDLSTALFADVTVNPGAGSSNLNIEDNNATVARHYTIDTGMVSTDIPGEGVIHFGRVSDVKLGTGNHHNTVTVQNTTAGLATDIFGNSGDTVNALGTALGSTLSLYGPGLVVNAGNTGHMSSLHGLLHVGGFACSLTADDSNNVQGQNDVVIRSNSITGLGPGVIGYDANALLSTDIIGSGGGSTYHVLGVPAGGTNATTTLNCRGTDAVLVGDNGDLVGIQSNLVIHNASKFTNLTIDGSAQNSLASSHATITNSDVYGLALGDIQYDQSALSALTIAGPHGGASYYDIESLPTYFLFNLITTLNLATGDTVNFGQNQSLLGAWGTGSLDLSFSGSGAASNIVLDGNQDPAGAAYTIGGNNNLTINNATVGLGMTINGFRDQDQVVIDLPGGTVNADLTQTSRGTIVVDGSARLAGTNVRSPLNVTAHARAGAVFLMPMGSNGSVIHAFNLIDLVGSMPQDPLHVYDSTNALAIANDPIPLPYAQFAAAAGDPTTVTAGQLFDFTIIAQDAGAATLTSYNNQVQWYSYNQATGDYASSDYEQFTPADQGQHLFHVVLSTPGTYTLGFDDGWNVSSFTINVVPPPQAGGSVEEGSGEMASADGVASAPAAAILATAAAGSPPVDGKPIVTVIAGNNTKATPLAAAESAGGSRLPRADLAVHGQQARPNGTGVSPNASGAQPRARSTAILSSKAIDLYFGTYEHEALFTARKRNAARGDSSHSGPF